MEFVVDKETLDWDELLEAIKRFRSEVFERLEKIEKRIDSLEGIQHPSGLLRLNWRLANVVASAQKLEILARNQKIMFFEFEEDFKNFLSDLKKLIDDLRDVMGSVDWELIQGHTTIMLSAAHRAGLPFTTVGTLLIDALGDDSVRAVSEKSIQEFYGASALAWWRENAQRMMSK
ncbi:MAG: hypothetical protein DRN47_02525 [Candidatus Wolframiiraptor sp.]|nr:MAG: hypothetical protein DRN47_02525 [Candidatus Wolframiiraptor sp.]